MGLIDETEMLTEAEYQKARKEIYKKKDKSVRIRQAELKTLYEKTSVLLDDTLFEQYKELKYRQEYDRNQYLSVFTAVCVLMLTFTGDQFLRAVWTSVGALETVRAFTCFAVASVISVLLATWLGKWATKRLLTKEYLLLEKYEIQLLEKKLFLQKQ